MKLEFISKSNNEAFARISVAAFAAQLDPTVEELADIKTAVEMMINQAEYKARKDGVLRENEHFKNRNEINLSDGNIINRIIYLEKVIGSMEDLEELLRKDEQDFGEEWAEVQNWIEYWTKILDELEQERQEEIQEQVKKIEKQISELQNKRNKILNL